MRNGTRGYAGALTLLAVVVAGPGCAGEGDALGTSGDIDRVEPDALVPVLLTEDDDVDASSFGPMPMTSENPGDDYYQTPPTQLCEDSPDVPLLADEDIYAYLGDGGDYLYIDHWVTGEPVAAATERFDEGLAAIEDCGDDFFALSPRGLVAADLFDARMADVDLLIDVALDKLASIGRVEVAD